MCQAAQQQLATRGQQLLIAPPFYWGINSATLAFPGSFTARQSTRLAVLNDIFASLRRWGFKQILALNLHGDQQHSQIMLEAVQAACRDLGLDARCVLARYSLSRVGLNGDESYVVVQDSP